MSNRHHLQNQHSASAQPPLLTTHSTPQRNSTGIPPAHTNVSALAYRIYLQEGQPQGRALQHWLEAEAQLAVLPRLTTKPEATVTTTSRQVPHRETPPDPALKTTAGLWIDHRKAVIAIVSAEGEEKLEIQSHVEKQPSRFAGVRSSVHDGPEAPADDRHEREFTGQLHRYYDEVIAAIRQAESLLLFGPGEAKGELKKRLEHAHLGKHIVAIETADKMTDRQIAAKVREYFHK